MTQLGGIYQWRQLSTGKKYIGSTKNFSRREKDHIKEINSKSHQNPHLLHAWLKHGSEDFVFEVLEVLDSADDKQRLISREQFYLDTEIAWGFDFNIARIAACPPSRKGKKFSDEALKKISEASIKSNKKRRDAGYKNPPRSPESIRKASAKMMGHPVSATTRQKIALKNTGKTHSDEVKRKMSISALDRSSEDKEKIADSIRKAHLGTKHSPEHKKKISNSLRIKAKADKEAGKTRSEQHKAKLLEARRIRAIREREAGGVSEETRRKIGEKSKGRVQSEETKRKRGEAVRRAAARKREALMVASS